MGLFDFKFWRRYDKGFFRHRNSEGTTIGLKGCLSFLYSGVAVLSFA
jgi:hypothetical protein